ncbi:unnamed protein product [Moneuplotes crassus]|uniref:TRP C-terminal domain-containing protein n=1 Tax=Euplotes crassus TaxID=5936 RepID=A0AAD1U7Y7_EUPCR|nr:unnamed protein product [Moneuplotes crassus]
MSSIAAGTLSGSSSHSMWAMFNQFQLFMMIPFLRAILPFEFIQTLKALEITILNINLVNIRTLPIFKEIIDHIDYKNPYQEFRDNEYESGSSLVSCFDIFAYLLGATLLALLLYPSLKIFCKTKSKGCLSKICCYVSDFFYFKFYFRYLIEVSLLICLISVSEVFRISDASANLISYIISVITVFLLFLFMCLIPILYFSVKNPHENKYVKELFEGFRKSKYAQLYNFTFLLRRFLIVVVIVALREDYLMLRLMVFVLLQVLILVLAVIVRHHDQKCPNIIEIVNEVSYSLTIFLIIALQRYESRILEVLLNNSVITNTMAVLIISVINLIYQILLNCKSRKKSKRVLSSTKIVTVKSSQKFNIQKKIFAIDNEGHGNSSTKKETGGTTRSVSRDIEMSNDQGRGSRRRDQVYPIFNEVDTRDYKPRVYQKPSNTTLPGLRTPR